MPTLRAATGEFTGSARDIVDSFIESLPRLGLAIGIVLVGLGLSRLLRWVMHSWLSRGRTPSFAQVMSKLAGWLLLGLAVLSAIAALFPSVQPVDLLAGLGFFSIAVGFAFQDILENTLSGVLLLFRQPFRSGDQIEVQGHTGTVEAITIRETRIRTFDGQLVVIPNRDVYKGVIRVQTHFDERRLSFTVGIAYESDTRQACRIVVDALSGVADVSDDPAPEALVTGLGVSTVDIDARFWTSPRQHDGLVVMAEAITAVKEALDDAGIEMPADIVALQATPSFLSAVRGDGEVTPAGGVVRVRS